ncbi:MAG: MFS transporter [Acetobacteraceae bacterium]|nr:MFS transporter [Acetobacteraceae bacterium]
MDQQATESRRAVTAATVGNVLEWYDFSVYAYFAGTIGRKFFPSGDPTAELLATFLVFGLGFIVRPLGGIVIGRIGDTHGRRTALVLTILLMAVGTAMIGLLPTYAQIGIAAPLLLLVARLLQGFSAGGEWGGSTAFMVEWAPPGRRGWTGSFQQMSVAGGLLLGSAIGAFLSTVVPAETMEAWGWRVPFLFGAVLGFVGQYLRRNVEETPAYRAAAQQEAKPEAEEGTSNWSLALRAFLFTVHWTVSYYIVLTYLQSFTQTQLGLGRAAALWANAIGLVVLIALIPLAGRMSDSIGRKPLMLASCAAFVVLPWPLFKWMLGAPGFGTVVAVHVILSIGIALFSGPGPAAIAEIFPTRSRSLWMTASYALAVAIFGGFAPYIATWLIANTGDPVSPTWYVIVAAIVSGLTIARLPETAHRPLA